MKRIFGILICCVFLAFFMACGEDEPERSEEPVPDTPEETFAHSITKMNANYQDLYHLFCRCTWSENYESEDECLDRPEIHYNYETVHSCLVRVSDDMRPYGGGMAELSECSDNAATRLDTCSGYISETCSDRSVGDWQNCLDGYFERMDSCFVLYGEDDDWSDEYFDNAKVSCGLIVSL